jgi:Fur family transcriptional regulator, ferric uptake regulator
MLHYQNLLTTLAPPMNLKETYENELRQHGLKATAVRTAVLTIFKKSKATLAQSAIEKKLGEADRVTLYRTLRDMETSGIIHKVISAKGETKYALCTSHCSDHTHNDNHIHFTCTECNETYCLTNLKPRNVVMPDGFVLAQMQVIASGCCQNCS